MAVNSALRLVIKGREMYHNDLKDHFYCMVELFLLLRGKLYAIDDQKIQSLMLNEWDLSAFIQELIQALMPLKEFGGYQRNYQKEIEASSYIATTYIVGIYVYVFVYN